nr:MAG: hypothetical protein [Bacteriophage sp.]
MGTISDKLMRIINTKEDIRQALISKGYDVPTSIPFKEYAKMISDLPCRVDSFPDIEGIVARYSALGLTNEQMATNPVWVDKTGNGHDLQLKNFSWKGMSGVGGYGDENHQTFYKFTLDDYVFIASPPGVKHMNFTFRVTGLQPGNKLTLAFFGTTNTIYGTWNKDGIYTVDADIVEAGKPTYFYNGYGATRGEFTIEILPLYPGALVFDGVDDYGVCDNFPILTKEKGYTVVALRQYLFNTTDKIRSLVTNAPRSIVSRSTLTFELIGSNGAKTNFSFGRSNLVSDFEPNVFSYMTSKSYNGKTITPGDVTESNKRILVGNFSENGKYGSNVAIWELVFLDHDATEEELTKIKDYFVKTYPWLFPDQAWTTVGKTNEDEDRATIANITGNGNDLILSNFGFSKNSGYGLYQQNYAIWIKVSNGATFTVTSSKIHVTSVTAEEHADFIYTTGQQLKQKIRITGLPEGVSFVIGRSGVNLKIISQDGIYDVDILDDSSANPIIGYRINRILDSCDITIEQIPEYEGYLITDGVDDKVQSSSFTMNEDWTIVGDWELLSNVQINCGIVKAQNVYLYNTANGLLISINNPRSLQSFGTKSLHAICSDGRLYDRNWVEYEYTVDQNFAIVESSLNIGFNLNDYTQIAFKNLGIYNNQILYKDDCIKAYNYLQTLKAK